MEIYKKYDKLPQSTNFTRRPCMEKWKSTEKHTDDLNNNLLPKSKEVIYWLKWIENDLRKQTFQWFDEEDDIEYQIDEAFK